MSTEEDGTTAVSAAWLSALVLDERQQKRVRAAVERRRPRCKWCGAADFVVGDAFYVGFLFHREEPHAWSIELTCENAACSRPHDTIRGRATDFL
jgi:hypothetical protein